MSKMKELAQLGQSVWLDFIRRSYLDRGELESLIDKGLRGVTSNPSIFEKAIAGSDDYSASLTKLVEEGKSVNEIYETLATEDIKAAAKQLRPVYDLTEGRDGFVSLEVNPTLADDTQKTITEAKRLFSALNQPNVMIKVPATPQGIPAIRELIGSGVNVNVTLIFSRGSYKEVMNAYISGLERLAQNGPTVKGGLKVDKVGSVASFFVSRVDNAVDKKLEEAGNFELQGKIAVANAKAAYADFQKTFNGEHWEKLAGQGARVQRPLWASTSTKNPQYSDTLYVDALIGPHTVNTIPPDTLENFFDHGIVSVTLTENVEEAQAQLNKLKELGIDFNEITQQLLDEGVEAFAKSFESLLASIHNKRLLLLERKE